MPSSATTTAAASSLLIRLLLLLPRQPLGPPQCQIALSQPPTRLDNLHDIDKLLEEHDGEAGARQHPRPEAVHLVGASQLERRRAVRAGKDLPQQCLVDLRARLDVIHQWRLQQRRRQRRRREGEEVERDEEELVGGAADE